MQKFNIKKRIRTLYSITVVESFKLAGASWVALLAFTRSSGFRDICLFLCVFCRYDYIVTGYGMVHAIMTCKIPLRGI